MRGTWFCRCLLIISLTLVFGATLTTGARLQGGKRIILNVVALDRHDQPVRDLDIEDFHISDEGKAQQIVSFGRSEDTGPAAKPHVLLVFDLLNTNQLGVNYAENEIAQSLEHSEISDSIFLYLLTS